MTTASITTTRRSLAFLRFLTLAILGVSALALSVAPAGAWPGQGWDDDSWEYSWDDDRRYHDDGTDCDHDQSYHAERHDSDHRRYRDDRVHGDRVHGDRRYHDDGTVCRHDRGYHDDRRYSDDRIHGESYWERDRDRRWTRDQQWDRAGDLVLQVVHRSLGRYSDPRLHIYPYIPRFKAENAASLHGIDPRSILVLYDDGLAGGGKTGWLLTDRHVYWRFIAGDRPYYLDFRDIHRAVARDSNFRLNGYDVPTTMSREPRYAAGRYADLMLDLANAFR